MPKKKEIQQVIKRTCSQITVSEFMQCMYQRKYEVLHVSGVVNEAELSATWEAIFQEYCGLLELTQYIKIKKLIIEMTVLSGRLSAVSAMVELLQQGYCQEAVDMLRQLGYNYKFDRNDVRGYEKNIEAVISKSKTILIKLQMAESELIKLESEGKEKVSTEIDFLNGVTALSKFMGFSIDINSCSMLQYISYQRAYKSYISIKESQNNGR